jgi:hypothetical protein
MAVFWNENGTWNINKTFEGGTSSNHVEFKLLNHGSGTVPTVTLETHTSNYNVHVYHERLALEEGTGTDNLRGYFGADSYLSWLETTNTLTVPGAITSTGNITANGTTLTGATDISGKQDTITGAATTIDDANLTANRAVISNGSGKVAVSAVTSTELGYLDGVTSAIQTQLNNNTSNATHTGDVTGATALTIKTNVALAGNPTTTTQAANNNSTRIATTAYVQTELSDLIGTAGSTLDTLGELSASLAEDSGSLVSLVTTVGTKLAKASNLSDLANAGTARSNLGLGTVATEAASAFATSTQGTKADNAAAKASNLSDLANAGTARSNLGLGAAAVLGTAAVTNGASTLATGNQIYDHVTTRISGLTSNAGTVNTSGTINANEFAAFADADTLKALTAAETRDALNVADGANNYVLPTNLAGDDISVDTGALTGATVISDLDFNVTTNTSGLVTDANGTVATRTLTLANLGYTGATDANNYVLPTNLAGDDINIDTTALTGATVISDLDFNITTNTSGLVTDANGSIATRTLTLANLGYTGATDANKYVLPTNLAGDDISVDTGALTGATVISDLDFNITTNTSGLVTDANGTVATRTLTLANLGYTGATNATANAGTLTGNGTTNRVPIYSGTTTFTTDSGFTYASNILSAEKLNITSIAATTSENTTVMIDGDGVTLTRELGSNAFNSTTIPSNTNQLTNGAGFTTNAGTVDTSGTVNANEFAVFADADTLKALTTTEVRSALNVANGANNYVLPTNLAGDDISVDTGALTGATVISDLDFNVTTNTSGLVTDANGSVATRTLTLANLGYTGATDANNYVLPTNLAGDDINIDTGALTGAVVISDLDFNITTNTSGLVTDANAAIATRTLTLANLGYTGATDANNYVLPTNLAGDDINIDTGALTGATVISDLDFNVTTNTSGLVTDANAAVATRTLTLANLGYTGATNATANTLSDSVSSTSTTVAASSAAVKSAYDRGSTGITNAATAQTTANAALPKAGGTMSGAIAMGNQNITGIGNVDGNSLDISGKSNIPYRDMDWSGNISANNISAANGDIIYHHGSVSTVAGKIYYMASNGSLALADADNESTSKGLLVVALSTNATAGMLLRGIVKLNTNPNATLGMPIYLSTTAGAAGGSAPSGTNDVVRILGYQLTNGGEESSTNICYFNPDNTYIKVS